MFRVGEVLTWISLLIMGVAIILRIARIVTVSGISPDELFLVALVILMPGSVLIFCGQSVHAERR